MNRNENLLKNFGIPRSVSPTNVLLNKTTNSPKKAEDVFTCFNKISPKQEPNYFQNTLYKGFPQMHLEVKFLFIKF